jgi:RNA polymerase-associated protein
MALRSRLAPDKVPIKPALNAGLTLFVSNDSLGCDWARLVLAEKDIDGSKIEIIGVGRINEDFLVLNPTQSVPTLVDREGVLPYARVIVEYLEERYPHPPLMPQEPASRARARVALQQIEQDLFAASDMLLRGSGRSAEAARQVLLEGVRSGARRVSGSGYMLGREYTLADCAWAVLLRRFVMHGGLPTTELAAWRGYAQRVFSRRAFRHCFGDITGKPQK